MMGNSINDIDNGTLNRNEKSIKKLCIIITGRSLLNGVNENVLSKEQYKLF